MNFNVIKNRYYLLSLLLMYLVASPVVIAGQAPIINVSSFIIDINNRIFQIESMVNSQNRIFYQLQLQLINIQHDIEILRGQIQENQYSTKEFFKHQKKLDTQLNIITNNINKENKKNINNNLDNTFVTKIYETTKKLIKEKEIYDVALALAVNSKNKQQISNAITLFHYFIKTFDNSNYQSNSIYWLGKLNYKIGNKDEASFYYATFIKKYPRSKKVPGLLYQIGLLMQEKGQINNAKIAYQKIIQSYPDSSSAKLAKKKLLIL